MRIYIFEVQVSNCQSQLIIVMSIRLVIAMNIKRVHVT